MKKFLFILLMLCSVSCFAQDGIIQRNWRVTKTYKGWGNFSDDKYDEFILSLSKPGTIKITNMYNKHTNQSDIYIDVFNEDLEPIHEVIKNGHIFYSNTSDDKCIMIRNSNNETILMWAYSKNAPRNKTVLFFFNATFKDLNGSKITNQYR